jgi:hypothetical protein
MYEVASSVYPGLSYRAARQAETLQDRQMYELGEPALRLELALLDLAVQEVTDPLLRLLAELGVQLAADGLEPRLDAELGDARSHRPEPDHADLLDLPCHRRAMLPGRLDPRPARRR